MLHPVGPLPPAVYWRRRLVLAGAVLAVLLPLTLAMCAPGGADRPSSQAGAPPGSGTASSTATPAPTASASGTPPAGPLTVPSSQIGGPAVGEPPAAGSSAAARPAAVATCPDSAISVTVATPKSSYQVGDTPELILTIRNTSSVPCRRDVGAGQEQIQIYSGSTRIWSSDDCYADDSTDVRLLEPGQDVVSTVTWSGWNSQPGCTGTRSRVEAGTYRLIGLLGSLKSPEVPLVLR